MTEFSHLPRKRIINNLFAAVQSEKVTVFKENSSFCEVICSLTSINVIDFLNNIQIGLESLKQNKSLKKTRLSTLDDSCFIEVSSKSNLDFQPSLKIFNSKGELEILFLRNDASKFYTFLRNLQQCLIGALYLSGNDYPILSFVLKKVHCLSDIQCRESCQKVLDNINSLCFGEFSEFSQNEKVYLFLQKDFLYAIHICHKLCNPN
jgi:hypothetical protein